MKRPSFETIYIKFANMLSERSHHWSTRVGCVITTDDNLEILAASYNGYESGGSNKVKKCLPGTSETIHAEMSAAAACKAPRNTNKNIYLSHSPCMICTRILINLGNIKKVIYLNKYRDKRGLKLLKKHGIIVKQYSSKL